MRKNALRKKKKTAKKVASNSRRKEKSESRISTDSNWLINLKGKKPKASKDNDIEDSNNDEQQSFLFSSSDLQQVFLKVDPESDDAEYLFCMERFTQSKAGEHWIKCVVYQQWVHVLCGECEGDFYIYDFCSYV